jgi:hypothetical protein
LRTGEQLNRRGGTEWEQEATPSGKHRATIVAEKPISVEPNKGTVGVRQAIEARRAALAELLEEYGDRPIPDRVFRARGLARPRERAGRRTIARREAVLAAIERFRVAGLPVNCRELAAELGDHSPGAGKRVYATVKELIRAGRVKAGTAGVFLGARPT